ncbi:MAG: DUF348 domain-containing protein [Chloroflexi bacterium]|nr:DUF348 domain-containing protein [Chloroflexota bacterium]
MRRTIYKLMLFGLLTVLILSACQDEGLGSGQLAVTVRVDGRSDVYRYDRAVPIGQFLDEKGITLGDDDKVNPPLQTQLAEGMVITITRVNIWRDCPAEVLSYGTQYVETQGLRPGETRLLQSGQNGLGEVCYWVTEHDGVEQSRERIEAQVNPIEPPRDEIIYIGVERPDTLVVFDGILAYISGGQAWVIEGSTVNNKPVTVDGRLDGRVFELSDDGQRLLYTRSNSAGDNPEFSNELWTILDIAAEPPSPVQLTPDDVLTAAWVPGRTQPTVSYSTALPSDSLGWDAENDLYLMVVDPENGAVDDIDQLIDRNGRGIYAYWGRRFVWSPDGQQLAWANGNEIGLVDQEAGAFETLLSFAEYETMLQLRQGEVWVPTLSWSPDGTVLVAPVHGPPYSSERPEESSVFDLTVLRPETGQAINPYKSMTGIWSNPTYSPVFDAGETYLVAFFVAREPLRSQGSQSEYDLWIADSDGSNARRLFPPEGEDGFVQPKPEDGIAWSPDARHLAVIYQGNLWIIDVNTEIGYPITNDEQASRPRWTANE